MRNLVKIFCIATLTFTSGFALAAEDSDFTVVPGIDLAFKQSSLHTVFNGVPEENSLRPSYMTVIPSILLAYGKFYSQLSFDTPLSEYHEILRTQDGSNFVYKDRSYLRQETTLTLGYRVLPALSFFAGAIRGETKVRAVDTRYNGSTTKVEPNDISFVTRGYFAGLSTSRSFESKGTLALSAAYTTLSGELFQGNHKGEESTFKSNSASGYSTSLSWSGQMSDSVIYQVGYRYAKYFYDFSVIQIVEPVQGVSFGLRKYF